MAKENKENEKGIISNGIGPSTIGDLVDLHSSTYEEDIDIDRLITIVNMGIDQSLVYAVGKVILILKYIIYS